MGAREFAHLEAFAEDDDAAGEIHEFGKFGGDQENGGARAGELIEQVMDFAFGADVNAAGGFIDDQDFALPGEPFGEGDFLLVTAAQTGDWGIDVGSFDAKLVDVTMGEASFIVGADESGGGEIGQRGEGRVLAAIHGENQSLAFAVLWE